jgi:transposase InsO family protein
MPTYSKRNPFQQLNNYDYADYAGLRRFILTGEVPNDLDDRQTRKLKERFDNRDWQISEDGYIEFTPLELVVVPDDEIADALEWLYNDPVYSLGKGINAFYATVVDNFLNISRKQTEEFLKKQSIYQLTTVPVKRQQKPIFAEYPNAKWAADLIDMNQYVKHNRKYRYILSVIDYFSRKVFAYPLKKKDLQSTINAFNKIIEEQAEGTYPERLITDNGSEFSLKNWCEEHRITLMHTESHSPTQNSLVENINGSIRRVIRQNFVRNNSLKWVDDLPMIINNLNNKKHGTTGTAPNKLWTKGRTKVRKVRLTNSLTQSTKQLQYEVLEKTLNRAEQQIEALKKQTLQEGDYVRISTASMSANIRKTIKAGHSKNIVVRFTPKIYRVCHIVKPVNASFQLEKYQLEDDKGEIVRTEYKINKPNQVLRPKSFFATELLKVDADTVTHITNADAKKLNKILDTDLPSDNEEDDLGEIVEEVQAPEPAPQPAPEPQPENAQPNEEPIDLTGEKKPRRKKQTPSAEPVPTRKSSRTIKRTDFGEYI